MNLYLFPKHNYYNRKIVRFETIKEYEEAFEQANIYTNINFIINDGISTTQIINFSEYGYSTELALGRESPSYCVVVDEYDNIVSRWWIMENVQMRLGQSRLTLLRDVVADYLPTIMKCPSYVKKGWLQSYHDAAIYNNETMTYNQIKTSETLIKDRSQSAWYVGYIAKNRNVITGSVPTNQEAISGEYTSWNNYYFSRFEKQETPFIYELQKVVYKTCFYGAIGGGVVMGWDKNGRLWTPKVGDEVGNFAGAVGAAMLKGGNRGYRWIFGQNWQGPYGKYANILAKREIDWEEGQDALIGKQPQNLYETLLKEAGKIYKIDNEYYQIYLEPYTYSNSVNVPATDIYTEKFHYIAKQNTYLTDEYVGDIGSIEFVANTYLVKRRKITLESISYTIPTSLRHCLDAPFDMFAIPAHSVVFQDKTTSAEFSKRLVDDIIKQNGGENSPLYDVQLVPYAPIDDKYIKGDQITLPENSYTEIEGGLSFIYYPDKSSFNKVLIKSEVKSPNTVLDFKVANECDMYRLCSPNYNGQFEFSATKNGGSILGWVLAFTYKPVSPYIKVAPIFSGLYGKTFNDARGLVCGGDFSLAQVSDAWLNYERQNKNYQIMFDRQIDNMEVNNSVQRITERVNMVTGTIQGATTGAMAGGMTGNPYAAAAGAVVGGAASLAGGIADLSLNRKLRDEAMDYARDQYGYQLQNIKALPYSLTKVSAYNVDNKIFPFLEYYTCSDAEKTALINKLHYNGMTIERIGAFQDYLKGEFDDDVKVGTFIQGKPIRLETITNDDGKEIHIHEDAHVMDAIANELMTGVYII